MSVSFHFAHAGEFDSLDKPLDNSQTKNASGSPKNKKAAENLLDDAELTQMQRFARDYRKQGLQNQQVGDLVEARNFYERAIIADPFYAVAYNDLGVILEMQGDRDGAEENYLKSIQVDHHYLRAYTNLALLLETKKDFKRAALFWEKRAQLGDPADPWTQKARKRLEDLELASGKKMGSFQEQEIMTLVQNLKDKRETLREDDKAAASDFFSRAKALYNSGNSLKAYRMALDAQQLDADNRGISDFIDKVRLRLLSK